MYWEAGNGSRASKRPAFASGAYRSRQEFAAALRDCSRVLLAMGRPLHYTAIARIIREQTPLNPTGRQVVGALRGLKSRGLVRTTFPGVYESVPEQAGATVAGPGS